MSEECEYCYAPYNWKRLLAAKDAEIAALTKERDALAQRLRYARRFLNPKDHDTEFLDAALEMSGGALASRAKMT